MEAFESIIASILQRKGYWIRPGYKVYLEDAEKRRIGRPSCPAWDLDLVAYNARANEILVVECKSYLGSFGVRYKSVATTDHKRSKNYKLFNEPRLRTVIFNRLVKQLLSQNSCRPRPAVRLCLAAGKIVSQRDRELLVAYFEKLKWLLFDREWIVEGLQEMASRRTYENDVAVIVSKLYSGETKRVSPKQQLQNPCADGCGALVARRFKPGHDAKYYSLCRKVVRGEIEFATLPGLMQKSLFNKDGCRAALAMHTLQA